MEELKYNRSNNSHVTIVETMVNDERDMNHAAMTIFNPC